MMTLCDGAEAEQLSNSTTSSDDTDNHDMDEENDKCNEMIANEKNVGNKAENKLQENNDEKRDFWGNLAKRRFETSPRDGDKIGIFNISQRFNQNGEINQKEGKIDSAKISNRDIDSNRNNGRRNHRAMWKILAKSIIEPENEKIKHHENNTEAKSFDNVLQCSNEEEKPDFWKMIAQRYQPPVEEKKKDDKIGMFFKDLSQRFNQSREQELGKSEQKNPLNNDEDGNRKNVEKEKPKDLWKMLAKAIIEPEKQEMEQRKTVEQNKSNGHELKLRHSEITSKDNNAATILPSSEKQEGTPSQEKEQTEIARNRWGMLARAVSKSKVQGQMGGEHAKPPLKIDINESKTDPKNTSKKDVDTPSQDPNAKEEETKIKDFSTIVSTAIADPQKRNQQDKIPHNDKLLKQLEHNKSLSDQKKNMLTTELIKQLSYKKKHNAEILNQIDELVNDIDLNEQINNIKIKNDEILHEIDNLFESITVKRKVGDALEHESKECGKDPDFDLIGPPATKEQDLSLSSSINSSQDADIAEFDQSESSVEMNVPMQDGVSVNTAMIEPNIINDLKQLHIDNKNLSLGSYNIADQDKTSSLSDPSCENASPRFNSQQNESSNNVENMLDEKSNNSFHSSAMENISSEVKVETMDFGSYDTKDENLPISLPQIEELDITSEEEEDCDTSPSFTNEVKIWNTSDAMTSKKYDAKNASLTSMVSSSIRPPLPRFSCTFCRVIYPKLFGLQAATHYS